jgi:YVTN family beta-propeller protein
MAADTVAGQTELAEFGILGPLEVSRSGRAVPLGGPRQRAVLALLLLEANRVVSMDRLAEDLWDGHPPEGWVTTVQIYVSHLRQALEPGRARGAAGEVLVTRNPGYLLRVDGGRLDAARFQDGFTAGRAALEAGRPAEAAGTLRQALGLWRGPVLADLADYAFTRPEATRLEELRLTAVEARVDAELALGRHDALTAELDQLAAEHPLRERLHGQLILALYRCGRQADALAAYQRVRDLLAGELGIDPGEPLRQLHAAVLAQDPALDWHGDRPTAEARRPDVGMLDSSPTPESPARPAGPGRAPVRTRWRGRRLLVIGSALAVAAAACIVAVTRPWTGGPASLPGDSVGLIGPSGELAGGPVSVGSPAGLAYGAGSVWAVDSAGGALARIDPATHAVEQQIPVGSAPSAVAVTGPDAWVANSGDGTVSRVSTVVNRTVDTIHVGNLPVAIASGSSGVWVANQGDGTVDRIDPATGTVTKRGIQVGARPDGIAAGPDAVWVANGEDGTVQRIDPATGQPGGPVHVGAGPAGIAVTPGAVWVANSLDQTVSKIDPATGTVTATIGVGDGPRSIVVARDGVWVSGEFGATLDRIDPQAARVVRRVHLGSSPRGLAAAGSGVWVAARPFPSASHRGGTLIVADAFLPDPSDDPPDPAAGFYADGTLTAVYDGLTAFRRSGGAAGLTLVPDLAMRLPRPTAGGTTYTFTLRRGIRYSNGAPMRASDFRRGMQRQLSFGLGAAYYEGIRGGSACIRHPKRCDLSAGIVTDDAAGRVTFRLVQADPDFLYKLGLPLAVPAPPGAPSHVIDRAPFLPGTGPYMISQLRPGKSFTLVRNPYFRQWSYAAQPAGYPSVIRYEQVKSQSAQESAVVAGQADLAFLEFGDLQSLAIQYPARVFSALKLGTEYASLNTRLPPFTNLKARQAVNYAIDRARIMQFFHWASGQATVTCQMLPSDFPGYQGYCPYTTGAGDGAWHGPDMEKARRLVRESGTRNMPVTVWSLDDPPGNAAGSYLVGLLDDLGYRARLHAVSLDQYHDDIYNPRLNIQVSIPWGWGADFPAPSGFFDPMLSCRSADEPGTQNMAMFCDPHVDALARQARAAQATDPAAARRLWARADHIVTDQAPYVPVYNRSFAGFVSSRVGNYQISPVYGLLPGQMWVR